MIHIIHQESKRSIRHTLEIDQVHLTPRTKSVCHDGLQTGNWATACLTLYADGAQVSVELAVIPCDIFDAIADATVQRATLCMILPVRTTNIGVNSLKIRDTLDVIQVDFCVHALDESRTSNHHDTSTESHQSKRFAPLINGWKCSP